MVPLLPLIVLSRSLRRHWLPAYAVVSFLPLALVKAASLVVLEAAFPAGIRQLSPQVSAPGLCWRLLPSHRYL